MIPTTYTGIIKFLGESSVDEHVRIYRKIEIQTADGIVELPKTTLALEVDRAMKVGNLVSLSVTHSTQDGRPVAMLWAAYDHNAKRTFFEQEMVPIRSKMFNSLLRSALLVPVGLLFFVVPGLLLIWGLYKSWDAYQRMPTAEEMRDHAASLANIAPPAALA